MHHHATVTTFGLVKSPHAASIAAQWSTLAHKTPGTAVVLVLIILGLLAFAILSTRGVGKRANTRR